MDYCAAGSRKKSWRWASSLAGARIAMLALGASCVLGLSSLHAGALPSEDPADAAKAGVAVRAVRLSSVDGHVEVVQDRQVIADPALVNQPLFEGSQIVSANDGRAEIQFEDGSVARLSPNTTLTLSVLQQQGTDTRTEIVVNGGLAYFELQPSNADHNLRVNFGTASFSASSFSVVRLQVDAPPGELAVFSGSVHLDRGDALHLDINGGESLALNATDASQFNLTESIAPDSWDSWNSDRDQELNSKSAEETGAAAGLGDYQTVGLGDLDASGNWYNVPGQGYIWSPFDAQADGASWDPYGYGHWVWYPGRGYVWVSGYSWGYAPYQCGTWDFYDSIGWGWAPGGSCSPWGGFGAGWYGGGGGGWYNIGRFPRGYRPPRRPLPGPIHPRSAPGGPIRRAGIAPVPVDRRPAEKIGLSAAGRTTQPVEIAGHTVEPLRPLSPREAYRGPSNSLVNHTGVMQPGYSTGGSHPVYSGAPGYVPRYAGSERPMPAPGGSRPSAPVGHPSAPSPSHASSGGGGGSSHPSGGGGGGGGGHSSGGGGGGGGGGTHK